MQLRVSEGSSPYSAYLHATFYLGDSQAENVFVVESTPDDGWTDTVKRVNIFSAYEELPYEQLQLPILPNALPSYRPVPAYGGFELPDAVTATVSQSEYLGEFEDSELFPEEGEEIFFSGSLTGRKPIAGEPIAASEGAQQRLLSRRIVDDLGHLPDEEDEIIIDD